MEPGEFKVALEGLGVTERTLSATEKQALEEQGYLLLRDVMDSRRLAAMREAFERLGTEQAESGDHLRAETGTRHVRGALHEEPAFAGVYREPRLLACAYQVLGRPFRLAGLGGREPRAGYGQQGLHADWLSRAAGEPFYYFNSIWLLDDFTGENGGTRVVPGSHRWPGRPPKSLTDPAAHHREEIAIVAPAGSVLVFNGHLLHSGTRNRSGQPRRTITCGFVARDAAYFPQMEAAPTGTAAECFLLD